MIQPTTVRVRGDVKCVTKIVEYMRTKLERKLICIVKDTVWIIRTKSTQTTHAKDLIIIHIHTWLLDIAMEYVGDRGLII